MSCGSALKKTESDSFIYLERPEAYRAPGFGREALWARGRPHGMNGGQGRPGDSG